MQTEIALYAQVASPDPSVTTIFACDNIPTAENEFSGQNNLGWCNEEASALMAESDQTPDEAARVELIHQIGDLVRADAVGCPSTSCPLITAWDTAQVEGPVVSSPTARSRASSTSTTGPSRPDDAVTGVSHAAPPVAVPP